MIMKVRFSEYMNNRPSVEITLNQYSFDSMDAMVEVTFFEYGEDGLEYRPLVRPNISFGKKINPEESKLWGDVLVAAYQIATRQIPPYVEFYQKDEIANAFMRVDEILKEVQ